mgnify:CR=1 FL=1
MSATPLDEIRRQSTRAQVIEILRTTYDPEIPVNVYDMGLVYDVHVSTVGEVVVTMTLTSPGCPVAGTLLNEIEERVASIAGVSKARVELVWDPPWTPDRMSEAARLELGFM